MRISDWSSDVCSSDLRQEKAQNLDDWWRQIDEWRAVKSLAFEQQGEEILPQQAVRRLWEATHMQKPIITTEVGQHQMWAAQHFGFAGPRSEERRVGQEGVSTCRSRGLPSHEQKNKN